MAIAFRKRATNPAELRALRRYAMLLHGVAHPGVVVINGQRFGNTSGELYFRPVDGETLADSRLHPAELSEIRRLLSATVAHLHRAGVAHRSIRAEHVIVDRRTNKPVLCGFGRATAGASQSDLEKDQRDLATLFAELGKQATHDLRDRFFGPAPQRSQLDSRVVLGLAAAVVAVTAIAFSSGRASSQPDNSAGVVASSLPGGEMTVGGEKYTVGNSNDAVVIDPTSGAVLLLQDKTDDVYIFDSLPATGADATGKYWATVPDAATLSIENGAQHETLVATDDAGHRHVITEWHP